MGVLLHHDAVVARLPLVVPVPARSQRVLPHLAVPVRLGERPLARRAVGVVAEGLRVALARRTRRVTARRRVVPVVLANGVVDMLARVHVCAKHT